MAGTSRDTTTTGRQQAAVRAFIAWPAWLTRALWVALVVLSASACSRDPVNQTSLLHERPPSAFSGFAHPERITDGTVPPDGAPWNSPHASPGARGARIDFELEGEVTIVSAWLLADHNDEYDLQVSDDGVTFVTVWTAPRRSAGGLRPRWSGHLEATGRFLRLVPRGGDGVYSVGELLVFTNDVGSDPDVARIDAPAKPGAHFRWALLWFSLITASWLLFLPARTTGRVTALTAIVPVTGLVLVVAQAVELAPLGVVSIAATRASAAAIAAAALVRLTRSLGRAPERAFRFAVAIAAFAGALSFFHYGQPQFFDAQRNAKSYVHHWDMRVYFPQAKYFDELGFDGVYAASIAAWADDDPGATSRRLDRVVLRDLRTHRVVRAGGVKDHIAEVKARFSPDRWNELVQDMRYFRLAMGAKDYERSLLDHGGNATPVWLTFTHVLFSGISASDLALSLMALLDPALLAIAFVAVGYAFGPMTALTCMLVFGANDYHMGGHTNWAGATLRHDWLAALLCAVAALGQRRWMLGGALLSVATALRAFPVLGFLGIVAAAGWAYVDARRDKATTTPTATARAALVPASKVVFGAAIAGAVLFGLSAFVLGPGTWIDWLHKVRLLSGEPHPNHISLELLFSFDPNLTFEALEKLPHAPDWQRAQAETLSRRRFLFYPTVALLSVGVLRLCRRAELHQAALLGLLLLPIVLYPANYYLHFVCALPALAAVPRRWSGFVLPRHAAIIWLALCGLCFCQYFTVTTEHLDVHYVESTVLTFAAFAIILLGVALREREVARETEAA